MDGFYAYIIGPDGHIHHVNLPFEKREDAETVANMLVNGTTLSCGN